LQTGDGSWDLTPELASAVGRPWKQLEKAFAAVVDDVERRARLLDYAGQLAGQILQSQSSARRELHELAHLLHADLRDLGGPLPSIAAEIDDAREALVQPSDRVASMLQRLLEFLEQFRTHRLKKDPLRRAFATALALRFLESRFPESRDAWNDVARQADEWLQRVPPGARFWLDAVERSKLLR
jgi:hypothetical protein